MIEIRQARVGDTERIVQLQMKTARETENLALDESTVKKGVAGVFSNPNRGQYWIAEQHGDTLGVLLVIPEWSDWRNGTVLWIHSLYVLPEARRRGIFKKLYTSLKTRVEKSPDLVGLRLYVEKNNKSAQRVYEKLGMNKDHYELYEWLRPTKPPNE